MPIPVSVVYIVKNESARIEKSLASVVCFQEIIVVDSNSSDNTLAICEKYKAKIFQHDFVSYGKQKQFAVEQATCDWVLCLDADEVLSLDLKKEIKRLFASDPREDGFYLKRKLVFLGKEFHFGKESKDYQLRLFNRHTGNWSDDIVHEKVIIKGTTSKLKGTLLHYSYLNLHHYFIKFNHYTTLAAKEIHFKKKDLSRGKIFSASVFSFWKTYLLGLNFLNGYQGFVWSILASFYTFTKYTKARFMAKDYDTYPQEILNLFALLIFAICIISTIFLIPSVTHLW
jgi:glycosyltransferase involved in cell wall biosynthesis